jgi:hypothetical protein
VRLSVPKYAREGSVPGWKRWAIHAADATAPPASSQVSQRGTCRRTSRSDRTTGKRRYHCSSMASDQVWVRGDGCRNWSK